MVEPTHLKKYDCQIGLFPQVGLKIKNIWNHHPVSIHDFSPNNTAFVFWGLATTAKTLLKQQKPGEFLSLRCFINVSWSIGCRPLPVTVTTGINYYMFSMGFHENLQVQLSVGWGPHPMSMFQQPFAGTSSLGKIRVLRGSEQLRIKHHSNHLTWQEYRK